MTPVHRNLPLLLLARAGPQWRASGRCSNVPA